MNNEKYFWKKKVIATYMLSIFVFLIHISSFSNYNTNDVNESFIYELNNFAELFFKRSITQHAVPLFFVISGVLFFRNYDKTMYVDKLKSRIRTLAVPFLIWNTIWMIFAIITSYTFVSSYFIGREKFVLSVSNILNSIFHYGCNGPFWFIFELFFLVVITPVIDIAIRNKYIGLSISLLVFVLAEFGIGVPSALFYSKSGVSYYILGGVIGKHYFVKFAEKSDKKIQYASLIVACIIFIFNYICKRMNIEIITILDGILEVLCAFSFWYMTDLFVDKIKKRNFYNNSFAVFAMHINVSAIVSKLIFYALPKTAYFALPNFILTIIITLLIINLFCMVVKKYFPRISLLLFGMR